jgi:hypothetical protein
LSGHELKKLLLKQVLNPVRCRKALNSKHGDPSTKSYFAKQVFISAEALLRPGTPIHQSKLRKNCPSPKKDHYTEVQIFCISKKIALSG